MKNNLSDEKLDAMLSNLLGSEVPEDMQFQMAETDEIKISVKNSEKKISRKIIKSAVACAAALCIAFPVWYFSSNSDKNQSDKNTDSISYSADPDLLNDFIENQEKFSFEIIPLESSSFYRDFLKNPFSENTDSPLSSKFNTLSTGLLLYLNLIPYEKYETAGTTLYIKVIDDGNRRIFTQEAYLVSRDENGAVSNIIRTAETVSEDEETVISLSAVFKGADNAQSGADNIISKFRRKDSAVIIDGHQVREAVGAEADQSINTSSAFACIRQNGELVPLRIFEFDYTVNSKTRKNDDIPEFIKIKRSSSETKYYTVLSYNCAMSNSFRTEITENTLW